jgi:ubiquinol-cytochrome c reductase cytochrome c1 subunit
MMRNTLIAGGLIAALMVATAAPSGAQEEAPTPPKQAWSFDGPFGTFDRASAQRGFQIFAQVCSQCHSMNLVHYDDLERLGFTADEVKAIAATPFVNGKKVADIDDQGNPTERDARPSDAFVAPFANPKQAISTLGAAPPDLSVIVKARADGLNPLFGVSGADYVYALLTDGYANPPADFKPASPTSIYNRYFPGQQISMPPPLSEDRVTYADGTKATVEQEAHDIVTFLAWAAEPTLEERHRTGVAAILFLVSLTGVLYAGKRRIWSDVHRDEQDKED